MTETSAKAVLIRELGRIAPEIEIAEIDPSGDLREEFDIDSMDFLNLVTALSTALGLEMPEADYEEMSSFDALVTYLDQHAR